jgi:phosphatidylserine/phosphatidylglycerophosphate/cardiolipin synthase-like enzyme
VIGLLIFGLAIVVFLFAADRYFYQGLELDLTSIFPMKQKLEISLTQLAPTSEVEEGKNICYEVYFSSPAAKGEINYSEPDMANGLIEAMNNAENSIDIAIYYFDLEILGDAILDAVNREVSVRMVVDSDTLVDGDMARRMQKGGVIVVDDSRVELMHNKFVVIDKEYVWTGSYNFTYAGTFLNNNNAILIYSPELAVNYTIEFEEMFEEHQFGATSPINTPNSRIDIGDTMLINCFAPEDGCSYTLINILAEAEESIYFMAYSFTHDGFGEVIREQSEAGVEIHGVFDQRGSTTRYSEYGWMRAADLDVWQDGNPYAMHHKVIIIDEEIVILGSYNFSVSADESNDENVLVIFNSDIARLFLNEYDHIYDQAVAKAFSE